MEYSDLPSEAQDAFDEAMQSFSGSVGPAEREKYVNGVERAVEAGSYSEGLANRFNLSPSDFDRVTGDWEDAVSDVDADDWEDALTQAGIDEKFRDNLVVGLTD